MAVLFNVHVDSAKIAKELSAITSDNKTMLAIHNLFAKLINPYVPMDEGDLSQGVKISAEYVWYDKPYAHYQYIGEIYGPNIPIYENGVIVGWRSPPGKGSKHPTGRQIEHSKEKHLDASKEWDKVAMTNPEIKQKFEKGVENIITHFHGGGTNG